MPGLNIKRHDFATREELATALSSRVAETLEKAIVTSSAASLAFGTHSAIRFATALKKENVSEP